MLRWNDLRTVRLWRVATIAFFSLVGVTSGLAQEFRSPTIPSAAKQSSVVSPEIQQVLKRGEALERDGRWNDALTHYENAIRDYPNNNLIERRLKIGRARFDVARRHNDPGYLAAIGQLDDRHSGDVYTEVLTKIHTHYVQPPNWQGLVRSGVTNLDLALNESAFVERYAATANRESLVTCRREIRRIADNRVVNNRFDAKTAANETAELVRTTLGVPVNVTMLEFICGAVNSLDDYSSFLTGTQLDEVFSQIEGNFVGLGVELKAEQESLLIVNVIQGGPADVAGIRNGDRIFGVDGKTTEEFSPDALADFLKGEEGTFVEVVVSSGNDRRRMSIERRKVEVPCVERVAIVDRTNGIGYAKLSSFQKSTSRDIDAALWKLHRDGMKLFMLDLRGNPGGLLTAAVEVADKFVSSGTIVSTRGRNSREDADYKAHSAGTWRVPLVVLIDGESASASEIFAAAIRDHHRGTVVGQRSYGKGSVQGIFPLESSNLGVRLTTAKFFSPSGQAISGVGVSPDVAVTAAAKPVVGGEAVGNGLAETNNDPVLAAALNVARTQVSRRQ